MKVKKLQAAAYLSTGLPSDPAIVSVSGRSTLSSQAAPSLLSHPPTQLNHQSVPFGAFHTAVGSPLIGGNNRGSGGGLRLGPMSRGNRQLDQKKTLNEDLKWKRRCQR